ncbi:spermatogenesis-associated protein 2-like protein [Choloepus didactylus]|uniref:spermatogenesis-associated protein 2-like protein n=1 Tax=Choloepus didactylus TaxID=27675 RepID=UPI0018A041BF|nr:spermatogenesis-associated protein 2-like protein [Choloepus didactylus]
MSGPQAPGPGEAALPALLGDLISYYREEAGQGRLGVCRQAALTCRALQFLDTKGPPGFWPAWDVCPKLVRALEFLELISVNLLLFPWRKEIRSLKTFTGSFAYWVQPVLSKHTLDTLLGRLGYAATSEAEFSLVQAISEEDTKHMVFDIFLKRIACEAILGTLGKQIYGLDREKLSRPHCRHSSAHNCFEGTQPGPGLGMPQQGPLEGAGSGRALAKGTEEQSCLPVALSLSEASTTSGGLLSGPLAPLDPQCHTSSCSDSEEFLSRYSDLALHQTPLFPKDLPLGSLKGNQPQGPALAPCPSSGEVVTPSGSIDGVTIPGQLCLMPGPQLPGESLDLKPEAEPRLATPDADAASPNTSSEMDELCKRLSQLLGRPTPAGHPWGFPGPGADRGQPEPLVGPEPAGEGGSPGSRVTQLRKSMQAPSHVREPPRHSLHPPGGASSHPRTPPRQWLRTSTPVYRADCSHHDVATGGDAGRGGRSGTTVGVVGQGNSSQPEAQGPICQPQLVSNSPLPPADCDF